MPRRTPDRCLLSRGWTRSVARPVLAVLTLSSPNTIPSLRGALQVWDADDPRMDRFIGLKKEVRTFDVAYPVPA